MESLEVGGSGRWEQGQTFGQRAGNLTLMWLRCSFNIHVLPTYAGLLHNDAGAMRLVIAHGPRRGSHFYMEAVKMHMLFFFFKSFSSLPLKAMCLQDRGAG